MATSSAALAADRASSSRIVVRAALLAVGGLILAGCNGESTLPRNSRHYVPISQDTQALMQKKEMRTHAPILLRAYKQESELEVWKKAADGKFALLKTYPMCRWSGQLGPKIKEGDRQVPEGFYGITQSQLNPNSAYYLSFNVGYPNQYDKALNRTGSAIMVHGACSSMGCFSMTDGQIADLYALTREALAGGQQVVQMQSLPFRMTAENLAKYRSDPNMTFWKNLKEGSDHFEVTRQEPQVAVCGRRYVFNAKPKDASTKFDAGAACPATETDADLATAVAEKARADEIKVAELVTQGARAMRRLYHDGDQHPTFREPVVATTRETSRPDALAAGPVEVPVEEFGKLQTKGRSLSQVAALVAQRGSETPTATPTATAALAASPKVEPSAAARPKPGPAGPTVVAAVTPGASTSGSSTPAAAGRTPAAIASSAIPATASAQTAAVNPAVSLPAGTLALASETRDETPKSIELPLFRRVLSGIGLAAEEPPAAPPTIEPAAPQAKAAPAVRAAAPPRRPAQTTPVKRTPPGPTAALSAATPSPPAAGTATSSRPPAAQ